MSTPLAAPDSIAAEAAVTPAGSRRRHLIRRDLLECEERLRDSLLRVISFESHAI